MGSEVEEIARGMRRELIRNIAIAPVVLFVRIPLALTHAALVKMADVLMAIGDHVPGMRLDYYREWRRVRNKIGSATHE